MNLPVCNECYSQVSTMVLLGIAYPIYTVAHWGSIPYVVEPKSLGTAFGLVTTIYNIGLSTVPTIGSVINSAT